MSKNIVVVNSIKKNYPDFAIDEVNFTIEQGSIVGLLGENGAGKTTIIKSLIGLVSLDLGEVRIFGSNAKKNPLIKDKIGIALSDHYFANRYNILQLEQIFKYVYLNWDSRNFFDLVDRFHLPVNKKIESFSTGMRHLLSISIALSHHIQLLILDEVTNGLDLWTKNIVMEMIMDFAKSGNTVFISSHIYSDLEKIIDKIIYIEKGRLLLQDTIKNINNNYGVIICDENRYKELKKILVHNICIETEEKGNYELVVKKTISNQHLCDAINLEKYIKMIMECGRN